MLTAITPVPPTLALAFAGGASLRRKVLLHQSRNSDAMVLVDGGEPIVLIMLDRSRGRRAELALSFRPRAGARMRRLIRFAQLTLPRLAETGVLVFARISPANRQGVRMARATGFVPGGFRDPTIWLWKERSWRCSAAAGHGDGPRKRASSSGSPTIASSPS